MRVQSGQADFTVEYDGTITLFSPNNTPTRRALESIVDAEPYQWFGHSLAVETRFAEDIIGALANGEGF